MKETDNVSVVLSLSCQHHYLTKLPLRGDPRKPDGNFQYLSASCLVVGKHPLRASEMCVCMFLCVCVCVCVCVCGCNLTVPFLSLMSHQCTQCASEFSMLEYINTSVYQVALSLQGLSGGGIPLYNICSCFCDFCRFIMEHSVTLVFLKNGKP